MSECPQCGASVGPSESHCKYCGEALPARQGVQQPPRQVPPPQYSPPPYQQAPPQQAYAPVQYKERSKITAGLLGILLGGLGLHKFYLGKIGLGLLYLVFCWTYIPALVGLIEGIIYLTMDEQTFRDKYCRM